MDMRQLWSRLSKLGDLYMKKLKCFLSIILSVCLMFSIVGQVAAPMAVLTEASSVNLEKTPDKVIYVDGTGSGKQDGTSAADAFATLKAAYDAIPENNTLAVIVVCGSVSAADGCSDPAGDGSYYFLPKHSGEVILTSVWGENGDYRGNM